MFIFKVEVFFVQMNRHFEKLLKTIQMNRYADDLNNIFELHINL